MVRRSKGKRPLPLDHALCRLFSPARNATLPLVSAVLHSLRGEPDRFVTSKSTAVQGKSCLDAELCYVVSSSEVIGFWGQAHIRGDLDPDRNGSHRYAFRSVDGEHDHQFSVKLMNEAHLIVRIRGRASQLPKRIGTSLYTWKNTIHTSTKRQPY